MYTIDHCPACHSLDITLEKPAFIHQFVIWKSSGEYAWNHKPTAGIRCNNCSFFCSQHRLTNEEERNLYTNYREEEYNNKRIFTEPGYAGMIEFLKSPHHIQVRMQGTHTLVDRNIDPLTINTVLDYGGDTGVHIPTRFIKAKKYVYDISNVVTIDGVFKLDVTKDPVPVDFLMCCHVLEHKSDPDVLIKEFKRYANKDTWIYIEVPEFDAPAMPGGVFHEHINAFNLQSLNALLNRHNIYSIDTHIHNGIICLLGKLK